MSVKVANGETLVSTGVCKGLIINIQGHKFKLDCLLLPLVGYNLVLGVQWLKELGPINCDFLNLSMSFQH